MTLDMHVFVLIIIGTSADNTIGILGSKRHFKVSVLYRPPKIDAKICSKGQPFLKHLQLCVAIIRREGR